jgi:hypothetical protein
MSTPDFAYCRLHRKPPPLAMGQAVTRDSWTLLTILLARFRLPPVTVPPRAFPRAPAPAHRRTPRAVPPSAPAPPPPPRVAPETSGALGGLGGAGGPPDESDPSVLGEDTMVWMDRPKSIPASASPRNSVGRVTDS